ncbi:hypothetical protein HanIR_Chr02g0058661 [Helianthus annuus]|nr:hypothetical protein HanIR_Chr02g0058661 [Helianthus annuus]
MSGNGITGSPGTSSDVTGLGNGSKWVKRSTTAFWAYGNALPTPILPAADAPWNNQKTRRLKPLSTRLVADATFGNASPTPGRAVVDATPWICFSDLFCLPCVMFSGLLNAVKHN